VEGSRVGNFITMNAAHVVAAFASLGALDDSAVNFSLARSRPGRTAVQSSIARPQPQARIDKGASNLPVEKALLTRLLSRKANVCRAYK